MPEFLTVEAVVSVGLVFLVLDRFGITESVKKKLFHGNAKTVQDKQLEALEKISQRLDPETGGRVKELHEFLQRPIESRPVENAYTLASRLDRHLAAGLKDEDER